ncbi:hypothetical protein PCC7424_2416 [Gloeothece citriformis PCC 7424]|uniref:Uncharacterized protein n=1 Tax=Gloeothece citriformis (strain PCC 7424) TaxID=65393 RepID=B7KJ01_GLOC7|nr:hypothetical protein [Gloeothece citriformis]ACK70837.1 hypothetical protein PCC7424_2416 [Gloeothece citriformis PCC 7424]
MVKMLREMEKEVKKINDQVIHAIPGRIRLKNSRLQRDNQYASQVQQLVESIKAVKNVRISPAASSLIVSYNFQTLPDTILLKEIKNCFHQAEQNKGSALSSFNMSGVNPLENSQEAKNSSSSYPTKITDFKGEEFEEKFKDETDSKEAEQLQQNVQAENDATLGEQLQQNATQIVKTAKRFKMSSQCLTMFPQFPFQVGQQGFEIGIPSFCFLQPLNHDLQEVTHEQEKNTELQIIEHEMVQVNFVEGGLRLEGEWTGKFRDYLWRNPLTKKQYYTPWIPINAVGVAELEVSVVDETLWVNLSKLDIEGKSGKVMKKLVKSGFKLFVKARMLSQINKLLSNLNGTKIPTLFWPIKEEEKLKETSSNSGLTPEKLDALLSLVQINGRVTPDYLWLSVELGS